MNKIYSLSLLYFLVSCSAAPSPTPAQNKANTNPATAGSGDGKASTNTPVANEPDLAQCGKAFPSAPEVAAPATNAMIRTVSAGRVRQRHESNGSFAGFGDHYFENRSYDIIIEDFTPTGEKKFTITLKPVGIHGLGGLRADGTEDQGLPNLRMFQNGGTNPDEFNVNLLMKHEGNNVFSYTFKDGGGSAQTALTAGRIIGFEFGFFFNKTKVEGRNSYYSDTFRFVVGKPGLVLGVPLTPGVAGNPDAQVDRKYYAGGDFTVPNIVAEEDRHLAYSQSSLNILQPDMQGFLEGRSLFHTDFVGGNHTEQGISFSPERVAKQKGLAGPLMDTNACSTCHSDNGRFKAGDLTAPKHVLKIATTAGGIHPEFGLQLQKTEQASSKIKIETLSKVVSFVDGTQVSLSYPKYTLEGAVVSARIPQMVYGLGLLEAVSDDSILARVPCADTSKGVSGRAGYAINPETGKKELARFGWKASKVSLKHQVSEALLFDMGVTNPVLPTVECEKTAVCGTGSPELPKEDVARLTQYMQNIAVPVQRNTSDPAFARGQKIFGTLGCASCHVPLQYTGATHPSEKLRNQTFAPYTDLLLHDMGAGLADSKTDGEASGTEWRTPPLWGLGLMKTVNGQVMLLHDGRAKSYEEAILWHEGEAASVQGEFRKLNKADREDLYFFLQSI